MATLRSDIIVPEVFTAYVDEAVTTRSAFINSGVIQPLDILNATEGGDYVNVPSWSANLSGDAEVLSDTASLIPGKIVGERQICPVLHRGRAWEVRTLAALAAGDDPMQAIGRKVADYISHQQQKDLFSILRGVFGPLTSNTTGALRALAIDSNATATVLSPGKVAEARAALGDQGEKLSVIAMHSKCFYDLVERKAIDYVTNSEARGGGTVATTGIAPVFAGSMAAAFDSDLTVPFYMGMRVIVSDDVNNDGTNFASYLFTPGAMASGTQSGLVTETDRDILALSDAMSVHWHNLYHPLGVSYTSGGVNPSRATLEAASNWTQIYETKNIGVVSIVSNPNF
jgi:hypothetical protein